jgi:hypothetical protein
MKKSDISAVESAKSELEAPIQLTPEQLETVVAAALVNRQTLGDIIKDATICGRFPVPPILTKTFQF